MGKLAKAIVVGSAVGLGFVVIRGVRNTIAGERASAPEPLIERSGPAELTRPRRPTPTPRLQLEPSSGPKTPLPEPDHPHRLQRINRSHYDGETGTVRESPVALVMQALRYDADVTLDELTAARLAKSEHGSGTFTELACIIDAELNRSRRRGMTLYESLTYRDTYGKQGRHRKASTRQDPLMRHLLAARAVLSGEARGVSRGAVRFFDPASMEHGHREWKAWLARGKTGDKPSVITCDALGLLEAWSFDYGYHSKYRRCPPNRAELGRNPQAWVGQIGGVDAFRVMLMEPMRRGPEHTRRYEAARALLEARLVQRGSVVR